MRYRRDSGEFAEAALDRLDVGDVVAGLPVRDFRWYRGRRHYSGWYWAATTGRFVAYESRLELARILLADFDPGVVAIAAQPFLLVGPDGARVRRHVPDVLLAHADGAVTLVEVKARSRLSDPAVMAQFGWTRRLARSRGWGFEVWSGSEAAVLANVRFLAGYRRRALIEDSLLGPVLEMARAAGGGSVEPLSIGGIEHQLAEHYPRVLVRPALFHLLWTGLLRAPLDRPLDLGTPVGVAAGGKA